MSRKDVQLPLYTLVTTYIHAIMRFEKSYLIIYFGFLTVSLVIGSVVNVNIRHPGYVGLQLFPYLLITLPQDS
jgi:hypothetical protein